MKIAFTSKGTTWDSEIDPRFGRTEYILLYNEKNDDLSYYDNRDMEQEAHGAGPKTSQKLFELNADILVTGNGPGGNAASVLQKTGIKIYTGAGDQSIKQAYEAFKNGKLKEF